MDDTPTPIAEIDHGPSKFETFLEENQKLLVAAAIAIFLGVLGYVGFTTYSAMVASDAGQALLAAESEDQYNQVKSDYPDSASAGSSTLLLAKIYETEDNEKAIAQYQQFIDTYPEHPAVANATIGLGQRLLNAGKFDQAEAQLNAALNMENAETVIPAAQLALGDLAVKRGETEKAKTFYQQVADLINESTAATDLIAINQFSGYKSMAQQRLRLLQAEPPVEVKAKPVSSPITPPAAVPPLLEKPTAAETTETEASVPASGSTEEPAPKEKDEKDEKISQDGQ